MAEYMDKKLLQLQPSQTAANCLFKKAIAQHDLIVVNIIIFTLNSVCQAHDMLNTHTELCEINTKWGSVISTRHV